ncbi:MAG: efflux RND transporter periplasmic adaptor subunit [Desulfomonilaceae bacterium]
MNNNRSRQPENSRRPLLIGAALAVLVSLILIVGMIWRHEVRVRQEEKALKEHVAKGPRVNVVKAKKAPKTRPVLLIGEAFPYANVALYAKISGYLQEIRVDKGDVVKSDEIIAILDSPELNKQHAAALADAKNKMADAERYRYLLKTGAVSVQTADNAETTARIARETAASLLAQKDYEVMRAPFNGVITARYVDPGALLQAATSSQTSSSPVVSLSKTDRLRVYVYPDQKTASSVKIGDKAEVADATRPANKVSAKVSRTTGQLDATTRTLLVEIDLDNSEGKILAGSFVQVTLFVSNPPAIEIPASGLVIRGDKTFVGTVGPDDKASFREVSVYESDGITVQFLSGVSEGEIVMLNVGESISEGQRVQPEEEKLETSEKKKSPGSKNG